MKYIPKHQLLKFYLYMTFKNNTESFEHNIFTEAHYYYRATEYFCESLNLTMKPVDKALHT